MALWFRVKGCGRDSSAPQVEVEVDEGRVSQHRVEVSEEKQPEGDAQIIHGTGSHDLYIH